VLLFSLSSFAKKDTFDHILRIQAIGPSVFGSIMLLPSLPLILTIIEPVRALSSAKKSLHQADIVKSGYILFQNNINPDQYSIKKIIKAKKIMNAFYTKLLKVYPTTVLTKKQVLETLNDLYLNGVENKLYKVISFYEDNKGIFGLFGSFCLIHGVFKNGKLDNYNKYRYRISRFNEEIEKAAKRREEANALYPVL
jgi:hypothetical protein